MKWTQKHFQHPHNRHIKLKERKKSPQLNELEYTVNKLLKSEFFFAKWHQPFKLIQKAKSVSEIDL